MPSDILIIPNRNSTTAAPVMQFSGSQANNIRLEVLTSGSLAFLGRSGSLFSINDSLSGSLMAVGDISGLPIFEVFSDDRVVMGKFNSNAFVVTGSNVGIGKSNPAYSLDVSGSAFLSRPGTVQFNINSTDNGSKEFVFRDGGSVVGYVWNVSGYMAIGGGSTTTSMFVTTSNGNVGIRKSNPSVALDVSGSAFVTGSLNVSQTSSFFGPVKFVNNTWNFSNDNFKRFFFDTNGRTYFGAGGGYEWRSAADTTLAVLSDGGDLSVGKSTANAKLDVNGNVIITGSLSVITSSGTGAIVTAPSALANTEAGLFRIADSANTNRKLFFGIDNTVGTYGASYIQSVLTGTTNLPLILNPNAGSVLIGTSTDSSNGRLQLPVTTTSAGGIGFGTETSLYRYQAGGLVIDHTNGTAPAIMWRETGASTLRIETNSQVGYISTLTANSLTLRTNSTNALTVTSTQQIAIGKTTANAILDVNGNTVITGSLTVTGSVMSVISNTGLRVIRASNTDQILTLTGGDGGGIASVSAGYQLNLNSADAAYPMTFQIGSSEKMRITSAGNVAIGKTTANAVLDVNGNTIITGSLNITGGITGSSGLGLFAGGSNTNVTLTPNGSGYVNVVQSTSTVETPNYALTVGIASTSNLVSLGNHTNYAWLQSWNSRPLAINPAGNNVGIGTTAPNYKLQVNGTIFASGSGFSNSASETGYRLKFYDNGGIANDAGIGLEGSPGAEVMWFNALNGFYFNYGTGGQKVTFTSNGNVGINKTTANATLDVSGSMFITGSLNISSSGLNADSSNTVKITGSFGVNGMTTSTGLTLLQPGFTTSRIISAPGDFAFYSGSGANPIFEIDSNPPTLSTKISTGNTNDRMILAAGNSGATSTFTLPSAADILLTPGTASLNVPLAIKPSSATLTSYVYLIGASDTTYTTYGLGISRGNLLNDVSFITHRGTGDFSIGCNESANLIFKTNNSSRIVVTGTGDVGVNKSTANGALDVNGNTIVTGSFSATTNAVIGTGNSTRLVLTGLGGPAAITEYYLNESFPRWAIGRDLITGGQAGIGFSDSLNTIATTGGAVAVPTTRVLAFYTSNATTLTERMRIDGSGNVAIGKTTANAKLDVNGNTIITGSLTVTDGIKFKGAGSDILHPFLFITFF